MVLLPNIYAFVLRVLVSPFWNTLLGKVGALVMASEGEGLRLQLVASS